jgi:hypothetical protein
VVGPWPVSRCVSAPQDYLRRMNDTLNTLANGDAACRSCPPNALCPGGARVVPSPGYWVSAPNSTAVHQCLNPQACGDGTEVKWRAPGTGWAAGGAGV